MDDRPVGGVLNFIGVTHLSLAAVDDHRGGAEVEQQIAAGILAGHAQAGFGRHRHLARVEDVCKHAQDSGLSSGLRGSRLWLGRRAEGAEGAAFGLGSVVGNCLPGLAGPSAAVLVSDSWGSIDVKLVGDGVIAHDDAACYVNLSRPRESAIGPHVHGERSGLILNNDAK